MGGAALATAAALAYTAYEHQKLQEQIASAAAQGAGVGNIFAGIGSAGADRAQLMGIVGMSGDAADSLNAAVEKVRGFGGRVSMAAKEGVQPLADMLGKTAPEAAQVMADALDAPATAGRKLVDSLGGMTDAETNAMDVAARLGDKNAELAIFFDGLAHAMQRAGSAAKDLEVSHVSLMGRIADAVNPAKWVGLTSGFEGAGTQKFSAEMERAANAQKLAAMEARTLVSGLDAVRAAANAIAIKDNPLALQLQEAIDKAGRLREALSLFQGAGSKGSGIAFTGEKTETTAYIREAAAQRGIDPDTALRVAQSEGLGRYKGDVGDNGVPSSFGPFQLHYGGKATGPNSVPGLGDTFTKQTGLDAADPGTIKQQIDFALDQAIKSGWGAWHGAQRSRIGNREGLPGADDPQAVKLDAALRDTQEQQKKINEDILAQNQARAGGNAIQQQELATARQRANGTVDEVEAAKAAVTAAQDQLSALQRVGGAGATNLALSNAQKSVVDAQATLGDRLYTVEKARADLALTKARIDGDPARILAATQASNAVTTRHFPDANSPQNMAAQGSSAQARDAYDAAVAKKAADAEDEAFAATKGKIEAKKALYRADVQDETMSAQEGANAVKSALDEEITLWKSHGARLAEIWGANTAQRAAAEKRSTLAVQAALTEQVKAQQDADRQRQLSSDQMANEASQAMASAVTQIATRHETLKQAAAGILTQMAQKNLQYGLQWVLQNSGDMGKIVSQFTTGELLKTAATTAGISARTAANAAGGAADSVVNLATIGKSVMASAGETFAGIFGFLSPVMGPAAAGPAAAGEAAVLAAALPHFAVGAWSLPSDMVAQVHQGEMIVPAGPAQAMRSALSGGGTTGTVNVQHSTTFVTHAIDASSVSTFFKNNERRIMRTINEGVRKGAHLGLSKLG